VALPNATTDGAESTGNGSNVSVGPGSSGDIESAGTATSAGPGVPTWG